jgi:dTDP-4-amino-4,6-dideoxygalactose transaminase
MEASGVFSNYGPLNTELETAFVDQLFDGTGACMTVCNATIGLMLAIHHVAAKPRGTRRYALMPSFTFAATAHATIWAGLTPLLCDIATDSWTPSAESEEELLAKYAGEIVVVVPYATFGNSIDLDRYERLSVERGIPVVVDAAASLGSRDIDGRQFGTGAENPVVFSMHATKTFATAEAGLVYSKDERIIRTLRQMSNFGFDDRIAVMPGLNGKLSEVGALLGLAKLEGFERIVDHRAELANAYRTALPDFPTQTLRGAPAFQFMPMLFPEDVAHRRKDVQAALRDRGIGSAAYFSPHLAEHPYFREVCEVGPLPNTAHISSRVISLPMSDQMTTDEVFEVCDRIRSELDRTAS